MKICYIIESPTVAHRLKWHKVLLRGSLCTVPTRSWFKMTSYNYLACVDWVLKWRERAQFSNLYRNFHYAGARNKASFRLKRLRYSKLCLNPDILTGLKEVERRKIYITTSEN